MPKEKKRDGRNAVSLFLNFIEKGNLTIVFASLAME